MMKGPNSEATMISVTTIMPKTASLFLSNLRHASRHKEAPARIRLSSAERMSPSPTANSGPMWMGSASSARATGGGIAPSGLSAGSCSPGSRKVVSGFSFNASISDPRIDERVGNVHQKIKNKYGNGNERHDADNQRLVARQIRVKEIVSQSRQRKDAFDNHGSGHQKRQRRAGERHHGHDAAAHYMAQDDVALAQAFGSRSAHVIRAQHFQHS